VDNLIGTSNYTDLMKAAKDNSNNEPMPMFAVLSSWHSHYESSPGSFG